MDPLKVVGFNVRYGTAKDGPNAWPHREALVIRHLASLDADLIGAQEVLDFQLDALRAGLPEHTAFGVGRDDGATRGEMVALFFRTERFAPLARGHFWLSPNPDRPGRGWDAALPRVAAWILLEDRTSKRPVRLVVTHFDHAGAKARAASARLLCARFADDDAMPIVTGDFNDGLDSETYRTLTNTYVDTYRAAHDAETGGTFHGFGAIQVDDRIDWILTSRDVRVLAASVERTAYGGRWPSDHHAVTATLA
ncbi:MAG: endonuclease/exonuclease/phosphatase family protein [Deltaproteobacteria bacterium]